MEFHLINRIRKHAIQYRNDVVLGMGDDGAVLRPPQEHELVMAMDTMVEGTHFLANVNPVDLGWKILAVNLSDLAAMGAEPAWAMLALTLPKADLDFTDALAQGFTQLASQYQLALVGGDTTAGPCSLSMAVHGFVPTGQALTRYGAQVDDEIMVTGSLGDAMAGLHILHEKPCTDVLHETARKHLIQRLNRPLPRVAAGIALRGLATSCTDVSDGLVADLNHLCQSSGVGAVLEAVQLPCSMELCALYDQTRSLPLMLGGGDDYELCFTVSPTQVAQVHDTLIHIGCPVTRIGRIVTGRGVQLRTADGQTRAVGIKGWEHFR